MKPRHTFRGVVLPHTPRQGAVRAAPSGTSAKAAAGKPQIRVGRQTAGRAGRGVSVITGLPLSGAALQELAAQLKRMCGAGGAVRAGAIEIQGEHRDRLVAELCKLGYEARRSGG